ncbi:MAG: hypothetical protein AB1752_01870 [Candidatus Zixiibacteriota bacterium]
MNTAFRIRLLIGTLTMVVITLASSPLQAQLLGQVSTARTLERGANDVGGYLGLFEDYTTVFGQYRHGLSGNLDFGLQGGIVDPDARGADAGLIIGGDLKWMVMAAGADPLDMALAARASIYDVGNLSVFSVGGLVLISRDYRLSQGSYLSPYGGVNVRIEHSSFDSDGFGSGDSFAARIAQNGDDSDTELDIGGVAGVKWEMSDLIDAIGELVLDDNWGIVLGLNFKL